MAEAPPNPDPSEGGSEPNNPCASNDVKNNLPLEQSQFGGDIWFDEATGEVNDEVFSEFELSGPCTTTEPTEAVATGATAAASAAAATAPPFTRPASGETVEGTGATEASSSNGSATGVEGEAGTEASAAAGAETGTASPAAVAGTAGPEEGAPSGPTFYSCSSGALDADGSPTSEAVAAPPNSQEITLTYDYELHTSSEFDEDLLESFENAVAADLASQFGLVDCDSSGERLRRRQLRGLRREDVLALGSEPVDDSLAGTYECEVQVDLPSSTCTPVRGYMTAWIPESSDAGEVEAHLLELIENGMTSDMYTSDDVLKVSYVGARDEGLDKGQAGSGTGGSGENGSTGTGDANASTNPGPGGQEGGGDGANSGGDGSGATDGSANGGGSNAGGEGTSDSPGSGANSNGANPTTNPDSTAGANGSGSNTDNGGASPSTNPGNAGAISAEGANDSGGNTNNGSAGPSAGTTTVDGAQATAPGQEDEGPPLLAIGIVILILAVALAIALFAYQRRRRRRQFFSDGPDDAGNPHSLAAQSLAAQADSGVPLEPDDMQLLPSPDKLDMRSVYSDDEATDCETENYTYDDYKATEREMTSKYGALYGGNYGDGDAEVPNTLTSTTMDYGDEAPASPGVDVPPSPMEPFADDDSDSEYPVETPGAVSYVGTVEDVNETPGAGLGLMDTPQEDVEKSTPGAASDYSHVGTVEEALHSPW